MLAFPEVLSGSFRFPDKDKVDPSKVKFASPFKLTPLPPVMTRLSALFAIVACAGNEVKFEPSPLNEVAVHTPVANISPSELTVTPDPTLRVAVSYTHLTLPTILLV